MSSMFVALALAARAMATAQESMPKTAEWLQVTQTAFHEAWRLPEELWRAPDGSNDAKLLPTALKKLAARDFRAEYAMGDGDVAWCGNLGDCVVEWRKRGANRAGLKAMLDELRATRPTLSRELEPVLVQLFQDDGLKSSKWTGDSDRDDDGMYFGKPIDMRAIDREPWKSQSGSRKLQQAAALVFADVDALKDAENDFPAIAKERGARYDFIGPLADSYVVGEDAQHGPFAALHVKFRYDLPFPFSVFDCDLAVLAQLDGEKHVVTYIYSESKDVLWLAGEDFLYPVRDSSGNWCAMLMVRLYGFDLAGVPDGEDERAKSLRASFGNLKRRAEEDFVSYGGPSRTIEGALPKFRVLGTPRK